MYRFNGFGREKGELATAANGTNLGQIEVHAEVPGFLADQSVPRWYAAYTSANHEKCVAKQCEIQRLEHFLPLYESTRQWKDRRMMLQLPLFRGYVFVRMVLSERLRILQIPGVVRLVGFNGIPTALPQEEVEGLKKGLTSGLRAEPYPFLKAGRRVRVIRGPLAGLQGIFARRKSQARFVVSVELIMRSVVMEIDEGDLAVV